MSNGKTCNETVQTSAALVGLGMMAIIGRLTQSEYDLGVAYVMGYEDAMACRPCDPMKAIDKFKEVNEWAITTTDFCPSRAYDSTSDSASSTHQSSLETAADT